MIEPRAPGRPVYDWIALGALCAAACVLLIGTLYVNKQGQLRVFAGSLAPQLSVAQTFGLGQSSPMDIPKYAGQRANFQLLFYFQAGNLEFLGLNLAWSVDVLSVLGLTSVLGLVMALGELLFNSRVVGRLGVTFFFFQGYLRRLTNFLAFGHLHRGGAWEFWNQIAFVNQRHLAYATGILLLVLIFLVDQYRRRSSVRSAKTFVFSGLLLAALPLWNFPVFIAAAVVLCCLLVAYGCWRLYRLETPPVLGPALGGALTVCILAAGVMDLLPVYSVSRVEVKYDNESLVKGLVFRRSLIYKIPGSFSPSLAREGSPPPLREDLSKLPATAFEGGRGNGRGQFDNPHGLAVDSAGNIFVADTRNGRIEKFSPNGTFVKSIAVTAPNGIAIYRPGNIYVAEIGSKHRVQKLGPDGTFIGAWAPGLYGPRKIAIGPDDSIYVVDSGRNRIVKFSPDGELLATWGSAGSDDGQFKGLTSVAIDPTSNRVYVADPINKRIQIFDSNGNFLSKWSVPEWGQALGCEDAVIDAERGRLYASSVNMTTILVFDLQGNRSGTLTPQAPEKLNGPSAIALGKDKLFVLNTASARISVIDLQNR